jgi:hypothetical protein
MKTLLLSIAFLLVILSQSYSLEPVRGAVRYTGGGSVPIEVQLYDFGTSTNIYPGAGNQSLGSLTANSSGVISFLVGKNDANWTAITAASVTNNYMLIVTVDGTIAAYLKLNELQLEQGVYGSTIEAGVIELSDGEILIGNSGDEAAPQTIDGDIAMTNTGTVTVEGLQGRDIDDAAPTDGQVLSWDDDNSRWAAAAGPQETAFTMKTSDQSVTNSETMVDATQMSLEWGDNPGTYLIEGILDLSYSFEAGMRMRFTSLGAGVPTYGNFFGADGESFEINQTLFAFDEDFDGSQMFRIIVVAPADVTGIKFTFAQTDSDPLPTIVKEGTYMRYIKVD